MVSRAKTPALRRAPRRRLFCILWHFRCRCCWRPQRTNLQHTTKDYTLDAIREECGCRKPLLEYINMKNEMLVSSCIFSTTVWHSFHLWKKKNRDWEFRVLCRRLSLSCNIRHFIDAIFTRFRFLAGWRGSCMSVVRIAIPRAWFRLTCSLTLLGSILRAKRDKRYRCCTRAPWKLVPH